MDDFDMSAYKKNQVTFSASTFFYKLEPGDGTMYRFFITVPPRSQQEAYALDSGLGSTPDKDYVFIGVNMPGGTGFGCISTDQLVEPKMTKITLGYMTDHGWRHVNPYTRAAVVLAAAVLVKDYSDVEAAAKAMLEAPKYLGS